MEYKKNHKIKLTKFGKKFFAFTIVLIIGISVLCLNNSNRNLKEETNNYLVEINYPKVNNKDLFYLPQRIKYPQGITLQEYIESSFYKQNWKWFLTKEEKDKVNEVINMLELTDKKYTLIDNLSSAYLSFCITTCILF